jgi:hypothetical protein
VPASGSRDGTIFSFFACIRLCHRLRMNTRGNCLCSCSGRSCDVNLNPTLTRWLVRSTGLCLALLALHLMSQSTARASCGDYLVHPAAGANTGVHTIDGAATLPTHSNDKQPCSGPNCSSRSEPLPLAPVTVPTQNVDQWGWFDTPKQIQAPSGGYSASAACPAHPIHHCSPLERPPRSRTFDAGL